MSKQMAGDTKKQNKNKNLREKILHLDANRKTAVVALQIGHLPIRVGDPAAF